MEAGTPPGADVGIQGRDGGLQRDSEAEPGEGLTDGGKEWGERKRRQDGAQVSGPSNGEGRVGEERGQGVGGACVGADGNREVGFGLGGSETLARLVQEAADIQVWSLQEKVRSLWHIDDI